MFVPLVLHTGGIGDHVYMVIYGDHDEMPKSGLMSMLASRHRAILFIGSNPFIVLIYTSLRLLHVGMDTVFCNDIQLQTVIIVLVMTAIQLQATNNITIFNVC